MIWMIGDIKKLSILLEVSVIIAVYVNVLILKICALKDLGVKYHVVCNLL